MKGIALTLLMLSSCVGSYDASQRRSQYDVSYNLAVRGCESSNGAFQIGYNDGTARHPMNSEWTKFCTEPFRNQAEQSYMVGFQAGAANAPKVVQYVNPVQPGYIISADRTCRFNSDCGGEGYRCRRGDDNVDVCMGFGSAGAACWFASDCLSGSCNGKRCQ